jgi:hypothetical protein
MASTSHTTAGELVTMPLIQVVNKGDEVSKTFNADLLGTSAFLNGLKWRVS